MPSTINLGLTLYTGWTCQLTSDVMVKTQRQSSMTSLLSKQLAKFRTLRRHWFPQHLLVGHCRWLRTGPLLDPAITQAISLFGRYLRQEYKSFDDAHEGSNATYIRQCWIFWQTQLPAEEVQHLLVLLRQDNTPSQRASRFKNLFKPAAIARLLEASHWHLTNRIHQNGWALQPSVEFLGWLADLPTAQVGTVQRFAILRWALGWCRNNTVSQVSNAFPLRFFVSMPRRVAVRRVPCVLCQRGVNSIDHWLSFRFTSLRF